MESTLLLQQQSTPFSYFDKRHAFFIYARMDGWQVIQQCKILPDVFDRAKFIDNVLSLSKEDFNRFCKEYMHLREFYDTNKGTWVTDHIPHVQQHPKLFWELPKIDFNAPVMFEKLR